MSEVTQITDHEAQAKARLAQQFRGKTKIEGFLDAFVEQYQDIEDVLWALLTERDVSTAIGEQLDGLGEIVGTTRGGLTDSRFRNRIIAKIGQNTSRGLPANLNSVFNLLTDSARSLYLPYYPAAAAILADHDISALDTDDIFDFAQLVLPGGVFLGWIGYFIDGEHFGFYEDPGALGFGEISTPGTGGKFGEILEFGTL